MLTLYFSCLGSGVSHFSKEPRFQRTQVSNVYDTEVVRLSFVVLSNYGIIGIADQEKRLIFSLSLALILYPHYSSSYLTPFLQRDVVCPATTAYLP